jgi:hypothetical protein
MMVVVTMVMVLKISMTCIFARHLTVHIVL